ncbi:hypothetical protein LX36DRAFT_712137 [Colletotrichum falcatum]|nr:hypothetical protein LX36DRAFT_712137 [Colletotrichum falcatum]
MDETSNQHLPGASHSAVAKRPPVTSMFPRTPAEEKLNDVASGIPKDAPPPPPNRTTAAVPPSERRPALPNHRSARKRPRLFSAEASVTRSTSLTHDSSSPFSRWTGNGHEVELPRARDEVRGAYHSRSRHLGQVVKERELGEFHVVVQALPMGGV